MLNAHIWEVETKVCFLNEWPKLCQLSLCLHVPIKTQQTLFYFDGSGSLWSSQWNIHVFPQRYCSCASPKTSKKDQGSITLSMLTLSAISMQHYLCNAVAMKTSWRLSWLRCMCQSNDFQSVAYTHLSCQFTTVLLRNTARNRLQKYSHCLISAPSHCSFNKILNL